MTGHTVRGAGDWHYDDDGNDKEEVGQLASTVVSKFVNVATAFSSPNDVASASSAYLSRTMADAPIDLLLSRVDTHGDGQGNGQGTKEKRRRVKDIISLEALLEDSPSLKPVRYSDLVVPSQGSPSKLKGTELHWSSSNFLHGLLDED